MSWWNPFKKEEGQGQPGAAPTLKEGETPEAKGLMAMF